MYYIDYYYCCYLFACLIISLLFIHKDCLDTYCFSIFLINITLMLYVYVFACEIINCLLFTVVVRYTSINDFSRIDKIQIVKLLQKLKFKLRTICFSLEFTPRWCSYNSFHSVRPFFNSYMATVLYWLFLKYIGSYKETIRKTKPK